MRYLKSYFLHFVVFVLALVLFQLPFPNLFESMWVGTAIGAALWATFSIVANALLVLISLGLGWLVSYIFTRDAEISMIGGCLGVLIALPFSIVLDVWFLTNVHSYLAWFPMFTTTQALIMGLIGFVLSLFTSETNISSDKKDI